MNALRNKFLKAVFCFFGTYFFVIISTAQVCGGSWSLQRPLTVECVIGQWVGWQNNVEPSSCPINPIYSGTQINTFTFDNPVSGFTIDFIALDGTSFCPRIEIKINGLFYPLTASNLSDLPLGSSCTSGSFSYVDLTSDGYITTSALGAPSRSGRGRIIISNINATSVTVSTNDILGTIFSNPFSCTTVVPLDLLNFQGASLSSCKAILNWQTGTELSIKSIEVQRSSDEVVFKKVGVVMPKGSNSSYSFQADNRDNGYFRLKINDLDGYFKYSEIIKVKADCNKPIYTVTPNPTDGMIEVSGLTNDEGILIFDMLGRKVLSFNAPQRNNKFNIHSIAPGSYIIQISSGNVIKANLKVIKD